MSYIHSANATRIARLFAVLGVAFLLAAEGRGEPLPEVFGGADFTGWKVPAGNQWWSVEGGVLKARSDPTQQGSVLWTEKTYQNFVLEIEFRFGSGTVDSGVFVRDEGQQIQIGMSGSLMRDMTGSPYIPTEKGYPVEATGVKELLKPDGWNQMTIVAKGPHYSVWLNGSPVMSYRSPSAVEQGPVGLQLHPQRDMAIDFRRIRIADLD